MRPDQGEYIYKQLVKAVVNMNHVTDQERAHILTQIRIGITSLVDFDDYTEELNEGIQDMVREAQEK